MAGRKKTAAELIDTQECKTCRFFIALESDMHEPIGQCRESSPRFDPEAPDEYHIGYWPIVPAREWCGRYQRRTH